MSTLPQPQILSAPYPPNDMTSGGEFMIPQGYDHHLVWMPTPATENHQLIVGQCSAIDNTPPFLDTRSPLYANQLYYDAGVPSTHVPLGLWESSDVQPVADVLSTPPSPTAENGRHGDYMMPLRYSDHDLGQINSELDPSKTLWPTSPDSYPFPSLVHQGSAILHPSFNQSRARTSHVYALLATSSHYSSSPPSLSPSSQSFTSTSLQFSSNSTSSGCSGTVPRLHLPFHCVPHWNCTSSSRRRHAACVIEHNGLWIDEEQLCKGLTEPDGRLTVHQCRWEEDHSPCGLWIAGDKSSINVHIQKWHGGTPGGDKFEADCRWSGCGQVMLKESITRHIISIHLEEMWECQGCGKVIVRNDAYRRHAAKSEFAACRSAGALITYSDDAQMIDARATLESGVRVIHAGPDV